jgi:FkbM family methyltransferase
MGFLSYAQNFEDVMLWRALGHVENGVYVDVGAQHPRIDSISRAFYERGWRGVHIEPVPAFAQLLRQDRPDETVLQVALGEREGTIELNVFADTGLSTAIASYAERHQQERGYAVERIQVPMLTMRAAMESLAGREVHWLKIDVEGFEQQVLRGWDSEVLRPWILLIEATIPNSTETDHEKWEPIVLAAGYRFAYFDGLNRFYIANEHPELVAAFSAPPNIFDTVEVSGQASWGLCNFAIAEHEGRAKALAEQLEAGKAELADVAAQLAARDTALADMAARLAALEADMAAQLAARDAALADTVARLGASEEDATARLAALEADAAARLSASEADAAARLAARDAELAAANMQLAARGVQLDAATALAGELEAQLNALSQQFAIAKEKSEELKHTSYYWWHTAEELRRQLGDTSQELTQVYASKSWHVTAPLRRVNAQAKKARSFAGRGARWVLRQPERIKRVVSGQSPGAAAGMVSSPSVVMLSPATTSVAKRRLSPRAARLYTELRQVVEGKAE